MLLSFRHINPTFKDLQPYSSLLIFLIVINFFAGNYSAYAQTPAQFSAQTPAHEYPKDHPIVTRCLPDSPCLKFPTTWIKWDEKLQNELELKSKIQHPILDKVIWITEKPMGILLLFSAFIALFSLLLQRPKINTKRIVIVLCCCALTVGIADISSTELKKYFGRLKPHVIFYNPNFLPALSFPSNHAFNTAVLLFLGLLLINQCTERFRKSKLIASFILVILTMLIGFSRILVGQHYPIDIIGGFVLGGIFSLLILFIYKTLIMPSKFWRRF